MKIAIAQMNAMVGDMHGNAAKIVSLAIEAHSHGATLMITPELALCGYPPEDLLFRDDFNLACQRALDYLCSHLPANIALVVGHPYRKNGALYNAASVISHGKTIATYCKHVLPNYSVFDEERYFEPGHTPVIFEHKGTSFGILICADGWESEPAMKAQAAGAEFLISLNASPYHMDKLETRYDVMAARVKETGLPVLYCNMVGGQDELVFDGASFVMNAKAQLTQQLPAFIECLDYVEIEAHQPLTGQITPTLDQDALVYNALKLGLADYVNKNRFPGVVLGLSGGIDSALTLAIAVDALGPDRVSVVLMASAFTAQISVDDALEMAKKLEVSYNLIPIKTLFEQFREALHPLFGDLPFDTTEENLQARIRGMLLMAISNKFGSIVVTTGNKSEMAVGYSTLYGDMAGGFALLKDVPKTLVYRLAHYRNTLSPVIPERIISRAPSAELRSNQTDQDSLPPYEILDAIMQKYVENDWSRQAIMASGYSEHDVMRVTHLIDRNEYKRRQSPVGVRITERGFGKDRRYPITCKLVFE